MSLFKQSDFYGGLNTQVDATKTPDNSYPLLINGRMRQNVVSPTRKHVKLSAPEGTYQGLYIAGEFLLLFVSGNAYYADINELIFRPVAPWTPMSATAERIYAELCPVTSNLFTRKGTPDEISRTFSGTAAVFPQAIYVFDGVTQPQVVYPDGTAENLGNYNSWTQSDPNYVPIGVLPAVASNKLFLASPDRKSIYHSVSGRTSDFMVNIDAAGDKGGDASTVATAVSYNEITAIKGLATGQVFVGTLLGSSVLELDYDNTIFGEPYLRPVFLFPTGPVNELSLVDILQDTAFITQSGIHAFNAVAQSKRESNNYPLGARIKGLLTDPDTGKSIVQEGTCAGLYDDYAFFAVNTVYGYGCIVYDTIAQCFQSLDLSFGRVKQFAVSRVAGNERMFFITHDNQVFEAFASSEKNSTRVYLGEFCPDAANQNVLATMVDLVFSTVRTSGQCKVSLYGDRKLLTTGVVECDAEGFSVSRPLPIPFPDARQVVSVDFQTNKMQAWKIGVLIEWNFDGDLSDMSIDGQIQTADNVDLTVPIGGGQQTLAFFGNSGPGAELNPGGNFITPGDFTMIEVVAGDRYVFVPNGQGPLVNGQAAIVQGVFVAVDSTVKIKGTGAMLFSLRSVENYMQVLDVVQKNNAVAAIMHGGRFAPSAGSEDDVAAAVAPIRKSLHAAPGDQDIITEAGKYFFNGLRQPRYFVKEFDFVSVFFFNGEPSEPDGRTELSLQAGELRNWLAATTKPFKIVVVNRSPLDEADLAWLNGELGIHAVLSSSTAGYDRTMVNGFPYFNVGTGGQDREELGYLRMTTDSLTCKLDFVDVNGSVIDSHAIYT